MATTSNIPTGATMRASASMYDATVNVAYNTDGMTQRFPQRVGTIAISAVPLGGESISLLRQSDAEPVTGQLSWLRPHQGQVVTAFQPQLNKGVDISGAFGDPVLAAASGEVVYSGRGVQGTGNLIIIRHSDRYLSAYAHNSVMLVPEGRRVIAGEKIAELGVNAQGVPMLHFEIRQEGEPVDPSLLLPGRSAP